MMYNSDNHQLPEITISSTKLHDSRESDINSPERLLAEIFSSIMSLPTLAKLPIVSKKNKEVSTEVSKTVRKDLRKLKDQLLQEILIAKLMSTPLTIYQPVLDTLPYAHGPQDILNDFYGYINKMGY